MNNRPRMSRRKIIAAVALLPVPALAQSSRASLKRTMQERKDWDELMQFITANLAQDFEIDLTVPEKTNAAYVETIESRYVGFVFADQGLVIVPTGGTRREKGQPIVVRGIFKARYSGTWYGYKRLWLSFVRDM